LNFVDLKSFALAPKNSDYVPEMTQGIEEQNTSLTEPLRASESGLKQYLYSVSVKYGLDYNQLEKTIQGESTFNPTAIGPGGFSVGICQFTLDTWLGNCSEADERTDPYKSMDCMGKLFSKGQQYRWDIWSQIYGKDNSVCIKRGF